jgi:hypothetical protein
MRSSRPQVDTGLWRIRRMVTAWLPQGHADRSLMKTRLPVDIVDCSIGESSRFPTP